MYVCITKIQCCFQPVDKSRKLRTLSTQISIYNRKTFFPPKWEGQNVPFKEISSHNSRKPREYITQGVLYRKHISFLSYFMMRLQWSCMVFKLSPSSVKHLTCNDYFQWPAMICQHLLQEKAKWASGIQNTTQCSVKKMHNVGHLSDIIHSLEPKKGWPYKFMNILSEDKTFGTIINQKWLAILS